MNLKNFALLAGVAFAFALPAVAAGVAGAQTSNTQAGEAEASLVLSPVDYNFVAQANLGAPFQIDSGPNC